MEGWDGRGIIAPVMPNITKMIKSNVSSAKAVYRFLGNFKSEQTNGDHYVRGYVEMHKAELDDWIVRTKILQYLITCPEEGRKVISSSPL